MNPKPRAQVDEDLPSLPARKSAKPAPEAAPGEPVALLAAIAHRLSQPLTALHGTLELARLKARSVAEYRAAVEKAMEAADQLNWLLQELRELAEANAPAGERASVRLDQVTDGVVDDLRPIADSRDVSIESRIAKGLVAETYGEHLYQALLKVVHHAILRSPEGKTVRVELSSMPDGAQWLIADEGALFPFAATGLSLSTLSAGHGLASGPAESVLSLVTAKQFIEALGGSLSVQSTTEGENRVLIRVPTQGKETC